MTAPLVKNSVCRTCLTEDNLTADIFETSDIEGEKIKLCDILIACTQLQIKPGEGDTLPRQVCAECATQLRSAHAFNRRVLHAHSVLARPLPPAPPKKKSDKLKPLQPAPKEVRILPKGADANACPSCGRRFASPALLAQHARSAHARACSLCEVRFPSAAELRAHNLALHFPRARARPRGLCCEGCGRLYSSASALQSHQKRSCIARCAVCRCCSRGFASHALLETHSSQHQGQDRPFHCIHCSKSFSAKKVLLRHQRTRHGTAKEVLVCAHCPTTEKGFLSPEKLQEHMRSEHKDLASGAVARENSYIITYYSVNEKSPGEPTKIHSIKEEDVQSDEEDGSIRVQTDKTTGKVYCSDSVGRQVNKVDSPVREQFSSVQNLLEVCFQEESVQRQTPLGTEEAAVKQEKLSGSDAVFTCQICYKSFLRLVNLEKHVRQHMGGDELRCAVCGFVATDTDSMEAHILSCKSSQAEQRLTCQTCGKKLTTLAGLRYHVQTHSQLRRHACGACARRFLTPAGLRTHARVVHSGARPHACALCPRRFASADHRAKHAKSAHHKSREHACRVCGKTFLQSSHVRQHMWLHTGVKPHACPHCPNQYTARCSLAKHLQRNHWEEERQRHLEEEEMYRRLLEEEGNPSGAVVVEGAVKARRPRARMTAVKAEDRLVTIADEMVMISGGDIVAIGEGGEMVTIDDAQSVVLEDYSDDLTDGVKVVIVSDLGEWNV